MIAICQTSANQVDATAGFSLIVTTAGAVTIELYAARTGSSWSASAINSDANGRSVIDWIKIR